MKKFLDKDFLLETPAAKKLYHEYAAKMPIIDYHCHINPRDIAEDKRVEAAIAINAINNQLANGNFDMDIGDGTVLFRVAVPFEGGMPDESIHYLIGVACVTVDEYNDKLLMLNKGMWTLEEFIGKI